MLYLAQQDLQGVKAQMKQSHSTFLQALVVLDFLIQRGSEQSLGIAKEDMYGRLTNLEKYTSVSAEGRDHGLNVRHR